jgi:hypothetical protein
MAQEDPPYSLDFFQTIVDVHFGEGLAVEFKPDGFPESYLSYLKALSGLNHGTVSVWFRIPGDTNFSGGKRVPVMIFGRRPRYHFYAATFGYGEDKDIFQFHPFPDTVQVHIDVQTGWEIEDPGEQQIADPGGVYVKLDGDGKPVLEFEFQSPIQATYENYTLNPAVGGVHISVSGDPDFAAAEALISVRGSGWAQYFGDAVVLGHVNPDDLVDFVPPSTDQFPDRYLVTTVIPLTLNHWHHLIFSFDFSDCRTHGNPQDVEVRQTIAEGTVSPGKFYYAIDDVNYSGPQHMKPYFVRDTSELGDPDADGPNPNWILTENAFDVATFLTFDNYNLFYDPTTYTLQPSTMFAQGIGIPAYKDMTDRISKIEMAELQVFKKVVDTRSQSVRRLFIDSKGKPVTNYKAVDKALGPPVRRLHGSGNWIKGKDTSSAKAAPFKPTGKIIKYKPDPSLFGPQSPSDLKK